MDLSKMRFEINVCSCGRHDPLINTECRMTHKVEKIEVVPAALYDLEKDIANGYSRSASLEYRDSLIEESDKLRKERDLIYRQLIELEVRTGQARADLGDDDPLVRAKKATERLGKVKTD